MNSNKNDKDEKKSQSTLEYYQSEQYTKEYYKGFSRKQLIKQYNRNIYTIQDSKDDIARKTKKLKTTFDAAHYVTTTVITFNPITTSIGILFEIADEFNIPGLLIDRRNFLKDTLIQKSGNLYIPLLIDSKLFGITQLKDIVQSSRKENKILKEMIEADGYKMKFKKNLRIPRRNSFI